MTDHIVPAPAQDVLPEALGDLGDYRDLDLASELFHRVNRVLPEDQALVTIGPEVTARNAVALMTDRGFSQLPVVAGGRVLGVFSFRSYALGTARLSLDDLNRQRIAPGDLRVDEFLEQMRFARVGDEIDDLFDAMDRDNGLIVGTPENAVGILTPMDFLRYLHATAAPFIYLSEIELALRAVIRGTLSEENLVVVAQASLARLYDPDPPPTKLEDMTFDNYASMLGFGDAWPHFENVVGPSRVRLTAKLRHIRDLRNVVFHFKRALSAQEVQDLRTYRHWLLAKVEQIGRGNERAGQ